MKTIIIYQSKKGTTKKLGTNIGKQLERKGLKTDIMSVEDYQNQDLSSYDYVFLGCWTRGLMIFAQHPDKVWCRFANSLNVVSSSKVVLFTTYKLATGSMFSKMRKCINIDKQSKWYQLKSKNGNLTDENADLINNIIA